MSGWGFRAVFYLTLGTAAYRLSRAAMLKECFDLGSLFVSGVTGIRSAVTTKFANDLGIFEKRL